MSIKKCKITAVCIIITVLLTLLSGCYDAREIDELAYVMAIGLDKGIKNILRITLQISLPTKIAGGGKEEGGGGKSSTLTTMEAPSIHSGLNMINTYISKQINLSHAKLMVISEELAREGMHEYIHTAIRGREFRPEMFIVISRSKAEDYLKEVKPILEENPSKYYEMTLKAYRYTGFTTNSTLIDFYLRQECTCSQAVATLAGVSRYETTDDFDPSFSTSGGKERVQPLEGDYMAGDLPKVGEIKSEIMGLAVFDGAKMVGEIDGQETIYFLMATGQYEHSYMTINDPLKKEKFISLNISQNRLPTRRVEMVDGKPQISLKLNLEADILSIQSGINYEDTNNVNILESAAEEFIRKEMTIFLERTAKEFKSDIAAFGKVLKPKYLTWEEWMDFDWLKKFEDSVFDVEVKLKVRRPGLIIRTVPGYSTEGEDMD